MKTAHAQLKGRAGFALPVVILLLLPLTVIGLTVAKRNMLEEAMAGAQRDAEQALMNAEAGLSMAKYALEQIANEEYGYDIDQVLAAGGLVYKTSAGDSGATFASKLARGGVTVVVRDNPNELQPDADSDGTPDANDLAVDLDGRVIVTSTGTFRGGERIVEAVYDIEYASTSEESPPANPDPGPPLTIFAEDTLVIKGGGESEISGPNALVHSNAMVDVQASLLVNGLMTHAGAGDTYESELTYEGGSGSGGYVYNADRQATKYVYPPLYKSLATYYMASDGKVYNGDPDFGGTMMYQGEDYIDSLGWKYAGSGRWEAGPRNGDSSNCSADGFYYVEGHVKVLDIGKDAGAVCPISIVAERTIDMGGSPFITAYWPYQVAAGAVTQDEVEALWGGAASAAALADIEARNLQHRDYDATDRPWLAHENLLQVEEILMLAGGDLKLQGNLTQDNPSVFNGLIATHAEFQVSGYLRMEGAIYGEGNAYGGEYDFYPGGSSDGNELVQLENNELSGVSIIAGAMDVGGGGTGGDEEAGELTPGNVTSAGWREVVRP
jgi:hypothetical protein